MPDIKHIFTSWGKAQQQLPLRNEILKQEVLERLNRLPELSGSTAKSRLPWISFALAGLAVITLILQPASKPSPTTTISSQSYDSVAPMELAGATMKSEISIGRVEYDSIPVSDNRELLKTTYTARVQARQVDETGRQIQKLIHQFDGRIDTLSISETSGYITFVLPSDKLESFQNEINELIPGKLLKETISAQNLLSEQKKIESLDPKQKEEERKLAESIATVTGSVSLDHVSSWDLVGIYAGPYWLPLALLAAALLAYCYHRCATAPILFPESEN